MHFERAVEAVKDDHKHFIEDHPIFAKLRNGEFTREHYLAYLRETYHLVKHTPSYLRIAAGNLGQDQTDLRDFYLKFAMDEAGHEKLCVHDIKTLGEDPEKVLGDQPNSGCWAMITQNYYLANFGNPVALIGDSVATEGLGAGMATQSAKILEQKYGYPKAATTFLYVHGEEDVAHMDNGRKLLEEYAGDSQSFAEIVHAWKMTLRSYSQLFTDVLNSGATNGKRGKSAN